MIRLVAKPVVDEIKATLAKKVSEIKQRRGRAPKLVVVLVGDDPASVIYTTKKGDIAQQLDIYHETLKFPANATPEEVRAAVQNLNVNNSVDGILIQRPLPKTFKETEVLYWVSPNKDVDAFHPENTGRLVLGLSCFQPCTPAGVVRLLKHYSIPFEGKIACVVGRSSIVGKPMAAMLLKENCTIIQCHSKTANLSSLTCQADLVVAAAGKPGLVGSSFIKDGAIVVDVGIHRTTSGKLIGDVLFDEVAPKTSAITPVPGGIGPMTIALLMENTVRAAEIQ